MIRVGRILHVVLAVFADERDPVDEDYLPALVADLDPLAKADARDFVIRGRPGYLPDQPQGSCAKVRVLFTGTVGE